MGSSWDPEDWLLGRCLITREQRSPVSSRKGRARAKGSFLWVRVRGGVGWRAPARQEWVHVRPAPTCSCARSQTSAARAPGARGGRHAASSKAKASAPPPPAPPLPPGVPPALRPLPPGRPGLPLRLHRWNDAPGGLSVRAAAPDRVSTRALFGRSPWPLCAGLLPSGLTSALCLLRAAS